MAKLKWDEVGSRIVYRGVDRGVLYPLSNGNYPKGVAWNGLTGVTKSPSGAEPTPLYANNSKYRTLMSVEELGGTIEAYTYPDEFAACDGSAQITPGVNVGQQKRTTFGLCYRTFIDNDVEGIDHGYELNLIYGALASPSERASTTINDSPEADPMSWEFTTTPVAIAGFEPTACITIDSTKADPKKLKALEKILYGSDESNGTEPRLPLPDEIATLMKAEG